MDAKFPDAKVPDAILVFECAFEDPNTGEVKMIAFDPAHIVLVEQCWLQDTSVQDRISYTECVQVLLDTQTSFTVKAEFKMLFKYWKLVRGMNNEGLVI